MVKPSLYLSQTSLAKQLDMSMGATGAGSSLSIIISSEGARFNGTFVVFLKYLANMSLVSLGASFLGSVFDSKISFLMPLFLSLLRIEAVLTPTGDEKKLLFVLLFAVRLDVVLSVD